MPELSKAHASRFRRIAASMARLIEDIRKEFPDANMYLEDGSNWYILSGDSHDDDGRDRQDRKLALEYVPHSSGGAW